MQVGVASSPAIAAEMRRVAVRTSSDGFQRPSFATSSDLPAETSGQPTAQRLDACCIVGAEFPRKARLLAEPYEQGEEYEQ